MKTSLRFLLPVLILAALIIPGAAGPVGAAGPTDPERTLALGVSRLDDRNIAEYQAHVAAAGRAPAIWSIWSDWGGPDREFPSLEFLSQLDPITVPMIFWQPVNPNRLTSDRYRYQAIVNGRHDRYIRRFAQDAAAYGQPVLLRFAHEMDGPWFPWSVTWFDNSPKRFIAAWRRIHRLFREEGATNVKFVWSPNQPCGQCTRYAKIYPGNKYVDYVAFSAFNWSKPKRWQSLLKTLTPGMVAMGKLTSKPVIIAETGSSSKGGDKAAWIATGYPAVLARWPRLKAIVYFDINAKALVSNQRDWRLEKPAGALDAYRALLADPRFQGRLDES